MSKNALILVLKNYDEDLKTHHVGFDDANYKLITWDHDVCGFLWGEGDIFKFTNPTMYTKWFVVSVNENEISQKNGYVTFQCGTIVHCGNRRSATQYIYENGGKNKVITYAELSIGDNESASAGDCGIINAGHHSIATAGDNGIVIVGNHSTAIAKLYGLAKAGDNGIARVDDYGNAFADNNGTAIAGDRGTAIVLNNGSATSGKYGKSYGGMYSIAITGDNGIARSKAYGISQTGNNGYAISGREGFSTAGHNGIAVTGIGGNVSAGIGGKIKIFSKLSKRYIIGEIGKGLNQYSIYQLDVNDQFIEI